MEWNVKNALSRDVERQQLNKILAEIRASVNAASATASRSSGDPRDLIGEMVSGNTETGLSVDYDAAAKVLNFAVNSFIITLAGDVTGSAEVNGLNSVTINTVLSEEFDGVEEAPIDGEAYWRRAGEWEQVDLSTLIVQTITDGDTTHTPSADAVFDALAAISSSGGVLPMVTGEISGDQPVFMYFPDGELLYIGVE